MTVVVSGLLLLIFPVGFTNYDTIYYLLWGKQIALGSSPDYSPPLVPTPHPLYDLLGAVTTPLGDGSITARIPRAGNERIERLHGRGADPGKVGGERDAQGAHGGHYEPNG